MHKKIEKYWTDFLESCTLDETTKYTDVFYFGSHENSANDLLNLVLQGKKRQPVLALTHLG